MKLTEKRSVIGVAGTSMSRFQYKTGDTSIPNNMTPARICSVIRSAQKSQRRISIFILLPTPVAETLTI